MSAIDRAARHDPRAAARRLFIYYRVDATQAGEAVEAAARMQSALRERHPQLRAELLRRADDDAHATLMETYALDASTSPAGIDGALRADIESRAAEAMARWIVGTRHVEEFDACA